MPQVITSGPKVVYAADGTAMPVWVHDPNDVLDYTLDWSVQLVSDDSIVGVTYVVLPGSELFTVSTNFTATTSTCWLQGGVLGLTYSVACRITTNFGRQQEYTFEIVCGQN